jgi:hypothetical protein
LHPSFSDHLDGFIDSWRNELPRRGPEGVLPNVSNTFDTGLPDAAVNALNLYPAVQSPNKATHPALT